MKALTFSTGDLIALVALVVSLVVAISNWRMNRRQKVLNETQEALNRRLLERDARETAINKRGDMSAKLYQLSKNNYRVKVFNKGKAPARNVRIEFPEGNLMLMEREVAEKFPLAQLDPQAGIELIAPVHNETPSKHCIKLLWSDDHQEHNEKLVPLYL